MKHSLSMAVATIVLSCSVGYGRAGYVLLPAQVAGSDAIAKVKVLSVTPEPPSYAPQVGQRPPRIIVKPGYHALAKVKVIQAIKGAKEGDVYTVDLSTISICNIVRYEQGEECLVFNTKMQNGHYRTFNTHRGKYSFVDNNVAHWKMYSDQLTPFDDVVSEIHTLMQTPK